MAISNSYNLSVTRNEIIAGALRILGVIGEGDTPSTEQYTTGSEALNLMIKGWAAEGLPIWVVREFFIELDQGQTTYTVADLESYMKAKSTSSNQRVPIKIHQGWFRQRTAVTTVWTANTAFAQNDTVYPTTENGFYYTCTTAGTSHATTEPTWPTVVGDTVTDGTAVWTAAAWDRYDIPLLSLSEQEYNILGNKDSSGQPSQYFFKKLRTTATVTVFPRPSSNEDGKRIYFIGQFPYADFDSSSDESDFPQEYFRSLKFCLANEVALEYGYGRFERRDLEDRAERYKQAAFAFNQEDESLYFQYDRRDW